MSQIPNYELYGELLAGTLSDAVHHENIKERSSKHDWTIRFHRHRRFAQIFLFRSPGVFFRLGDIEFTSAEPMILAIPPDIPHGFLFSEDVVGDVLSIRQDEMPDSIQSRFTQLKAETDRVFLASQTPNFENAATLISQVGDAYHNITGNRAEVLTALVELITLYLTGDLRKRTAWGNTETKNQKGRKDQQAEAFCAFLEDNFQTQLTVADYAQQVGISAPHLTRLCRTVLGSSPIDLVRQRRLLEAKRLLEYTSLTIAEIAHRCGFRDAAFFSRTFKSNVGAPPQDYRRGLDRHTFAP